MYTGSKKNDTKYGQLGGINFFILVSTYNGKKIFAILYSDLFSQSVQPITPLATDKASPASNLLHTVNHVPGMAARGQGSRAGRAVAQAAACAYTTKRRRPKSTHVVARPAAVAAAAASGVAGASGSGQPGDAQRRAPGRRARRGGALLCAPPGSAGSTGSPGRVRAAPASSTGAVNGLAQCVRGGQQADWRGGDGVLTRACVDSGHPQPRLPLRL